MFFGGPDDPKQISCARRSSLRESKVEFFIRRMELGSWNCVEMDWSEQLDAVACTFVWFDFAQELARFLDPVSWLALRATCRDWLLIFHTYFGREALRKISEKLEAHRRSLPINMFTGVEFYRAIRARIRVANFEEKFQIVKAVRSRLNPAIANYLFDGRYDEMLMDRFDRSLIELASDNFIMHLATSKYYVVEYVEIAFERQLEIWPVYKLNMLNGLCVSCPAAPNHTQFVRRFIRKVGPIPRHALCNDCKAFYMPANLTGQKRIPRVIEA